MPIDKLNFNDINDGTIIISYYSMIINSMQSFDLLRKTVIISTLHTATITLFRVFLRG